MVTMKSGHRMSLILILLSISKIYFTMIKHPISQLHAKNIIQLIPNIISAHTKTCPVIRQTKMAPRSDRPSVMMVPNFKRAERSAPCRLGFIPESWFLSFYSKTGVTGPYIFGIGLGNYLVSKEIFVLEHEYYTGLSIGLILYVVVTRYGPAFSIKIDKKVNEVHVAWEKGRQDEIRMYEDIIKQSKETQWRAEGQNILMDAKKECIEIQLETAYRQRLMEVYDTVKVKMDYQLKKYRIERRLRQAALVDFVLENVHKSITPEMRKQSLELAIQDLSSSGHEVLSEVS